MYRLSLPLGFFLFGLSALTASAQAPAASPAPDAATLQAAKAVVAKMQGDRAAVLASMSTPMVGMVQQMGVREPERAQVLVQEVILPVMTAHYDELLDIQARAYAGVLNKADLQAIAAFYETPAGRNLATAQPRLAQTQLTSLTQWVGALAPEMQVKLTQTIQAKGWAPKR